MSSQLEKVTKIRDHRHIYLPNGGPLAVLLKIYIGTGLRKGHLNGWMLELLDEE